MRANSNGGHFGSRSFLFQELRPPFRCRHRDQHRADGGGRDDEPFKAVVTKEIEPAARLAALFIRQFPARTRPICIQLQSYLCLRVTLLESLRFPDVDQGLGEAVTQAWFEGRV